MSEPPSGDAASRASKSYQTLQALQASEARFRLLVERNADGMVVVGLDGRIAYLNPAARVLLGRVSESLVGQPFGIPVVPGETTEIDLNTPGEVRHAEMRVVQTQWEGRSAFLVMLHDLTERERAAAALRQSEETFRLLVEGVRDYGLFLLDPQGRVASWNEGAERLLGYPAEEILGQPYSCFFTPEDQRANVPQHELDRARREGRAGDERWHLRRDGSRFWASRVVSPLREDSGQIQGFVKIVHDMTERKELEEELRRRADELAEADSQKNAFLAMLAHELRNPLAPIQNAVELLKDCSDERMLERARDMIEKQVRHMTRLVDDLLDISRITRGKIHLRSEPIDLNDSIRLAVESVRSAVERRRFDIQADQPDHPLPVKADATRIEQVLVNLLNNALKYSDPATPVHLTAHRQGEDVVVRIRDQGIGMDPEMLPRVFDLFSQADRSLDRSQGGLGIGLTLVRTLVEMLGGQVEAHSEGLGRGSEFVLRLPVCHESPIPQVEPSADAPVQVPGLRVLVVDDNQHSAESLGLLLSRWNHQVRVVYDGPSALTEAEQFHPDAILLDLGLPRMDGFKVARHLRTQKAFESVTIIAMTGYGHDDDRRRTQESGFNHHLVKPVDLTSLKHLLETLAVPDPERARGED